MHDLKDLTHDFHYENYRTEYIKGQKNGSLVSNLNRQKTHPVDDADRLLQQKDAELKKMQDLIAKMKHNMNCNNNNASNHNNVISNTTTNINSMANNNTVLSSFGSGNKNSAIKNLNIQGNHLISRHINNSYNNNSYQADKPNNYAQNLNTFQSLTNSTPI
jgi:septin family protein